jgi:ribosomal protein L37AE/L43A
MKCPKCGSEMLNGFDRYKQAVRICPDCGHSVWGGHEEKVPLVDPWNPYMADDDGEKP